MTSNIQRAAELLLQGDSISIEALIRAHKERLAQSFMDRMEANLWNGCKHEQMGEWSDWFDEIWMPQGSMGMEESTGRQKRVRYCAGCGDLHIETEYRGKWAPPSCTPDIRPEGRRH